MQSGTYAKTLASCWFRKYIGVDIQTNSSTLYLDTAYAESYCSLEGMYMHLNSFQATDGI